MSRIGKLLREATSKADLSSTSGRSRKVILQEAAQWLDILQDAGTTELASFVDWICESPQHLKAFLLIHSIDPALREIGAERLRQTVRRQCGPGKRASQSETEGDVVTDQGVSANKWERLKSHPLVITTGTVIVAVGITWAVANEVLVKPRDQQLEQLKSQLLPRRDSIPEAASGKQISNTGKQASRDSGVSDGDQTLPRKTEGASTTSQ